MGMRSWWPSLRSDGSYGTCLLEVDDMTCAGSCRVPAWGDAPQGQRGGLCGGDREVTHRTVSRHEGPRGKGGRCPSMLEAEANPRNTHG